MYLWWWFSMTLIFESVDCVKSLQSLVLMISWKFIRLESRGFICCPGQCLLSLDSGLHWNICRWCYCVPALLAEAMGHPRLLHHDLISQLLHIYISSIYLYIYLSYISTYSCLFSSPTHNSIIYDRYNYITTCYTLYHVILLVLYHPNTDNSRDIFFQVFREF